MYVIKRNGKQEEVRFDKISARIHKLCYGLSEKHIDVGAITKRVIEGLYEGISTTELDNLSAETAASMAVNHPDYAILAARIAVSNLHKNTKKSFSKTIKALFEYVDPESGKAAPLINKQTYEAVMKNADVLDSHIIHERDYHYDFFGFKTLERSYLLKLGKDIVERPQHMIMRVAVGIHGEDIENALKTYDYMSERWFTHATPTLFNSGTPRPQLSSCFLLAMQDDSIEGIFDTLKQCAQISKSAGGIGVSIHNIRAQGSYIKGTSGKSNGIVPMLRVYNNTARYVDQGGGKRKGAFAMYLEPWHADIFEFLELKKNHGKEERRARDLFYGLWVNDLFMKRVKDNGDWSLFCPNECPGLIDSYGEEFEKLYMDYESQGKSRRTVKAQELWFKILDSQIETGTPYMLYKDHVNRKSNQKNLGTIRSSNLCTEVVEFTSKEEVAVCNLASIALNKFVKEDRTYDYEKLYEVSYFVAKNIDKVIDVNYYPVKEAERSNLRHRPIGIGVQGLADAMILMRYPFDSDEAKQLNRSIFETIYFGALNASKDLAKQHGPYESYEGSPMSEGKFQFDLWGVSPSSRWDWDGLRKEIKKYGTRNSLLLAPMPTASTSQILGNNECFEPYTSNIYTRRVLSGEFVCVNKHLLKDLNEMGLWNNDMKNRLIAANGSVQRLEEIPKQMRDLYKTAWEIKQKDILDMAIGRGPFICQSQSMNIFMEDPNYKKLSSAHFYGWENGLKTGMYYLRSKPAVNAIQFTVDTKVLKKTGDQSAPAQLEDGISTTLNINEDDGADEGILTSTPGANPVVVAAAAAAAPKGPTGPVEPEVKQAQMPLSSTIPVTPGASTTPSEDNLIQPLTDEQLKAAAAACSIANGPDCEMCSG